MKLSKKLSVIGLVALQAMVGYSVNAKSADYETTEKLSINSDGINKLVIDAAAGYLVVNGDSESTTIEVIGQVQAFDDNYLLSLKKKGSSVILVADPNPDNYSNWFGKGARINLTVKIPRTMNLSIEDGSGNIELYDIDGRLSIDDGSGGIEGEKITGPVIINDGSGDITLQQIEGKVEIEDGSGSITLDTVGGKVDIDDGSGHLSLTQIKGHVVINDGSGGINLVNLENGVTVVEAGSGSLSMKNVRGEIVTE